MRTMKRVPVPQINWNNPSDVYFDDDIAHITKDEEYFIEDIFIAEPGCIFDPLFDEK